MKVMIDKETLEREYTENERPMYQIAAEYGVAVGSVFNLMKKYGIPSRKTMPEKTRKRMSELRKGCPSWLKGKHHSEATKEKLRAAHLGHYTKVSEFGGHRKVRCDGYIAVYVPNHPHATKEGYVMEHILTMEKHIGRYLEGEEVVHHKNKNRQDNRIENLQLMDVHSHAALHMRERHQKKKEGMTYQ